jgi:EAL domain-containing protein (putative c-di-GMP-specific phosphodiesterase class I)
MSARELRDPDFAERIRLALARHPDLPASALRLEVLETAALEDLEQVAQSVARCRELGVSFALDDFGTGYSSLTYLRRLPISTIKIDRSFVARMLVDPADQAIVRAVVDLAHAFGRTCVAEGAETPEHLQALRAMGCELAQGFAIARPMPAEDLPDWCRQSWDRLAGQADMGSPLQPPPPSPGG